MNYRNQQQKSRDVSISKSLIHLSHQQNAVNHLYKPSGGVDNVESKGGFTYSSKNHHEADDDLVEEGHLVIEGGEPMKVGRGRPRNSMDDDEEEYNAQI